MASVVVSTEEIVAKCRFCGSNDVHVEGDSLEGLWGVECNGCGASGPRCTGGGAHGGSWSAEDAVRAWNRVMLNVGGPGGSGA